MTTTPLTPKGLNSWNTWLTMVAWARLAASSIEVFTVGRLANAVASHSNSSRRR